MSCRGVPVAGRSRARDGALLCTPSVLGSIRSVRLRHVPSTRCSGAVPSVGRFGTGGLLGLDI
eukprot:9089534-Alexandrium_andersonii.AAC.1